MKTILVFNMNIESEQDQYKLMLKAQDMYSAIWDLKNKLRSVSKYQDKDSISIDEVYNILSEYEV